MDRDIKIKSLSKAQIIIAIDRLTRFKPTEEKYFRVFSEIVNSNLTNPKFKKQDLELMDYKEITKYVERIFEQSLNELGLNMSNDFSINEKLKQYEELIFTFDGNVEKLLENKIDYESIISLLKDDKDLPLNLKWLISLTSNNSEIENRESLGVKFPLKKIVIAEGITEEILLPKFAKINEHDFDKSGIHIISAGGKNQVVKLFYKYADIIKIPIFVLLDNDAQENYEEIKPKLRSADEIYILKSGEFEDLLPLGLIKRTLNRYLKNFYSISIDELRTDEPMTRLLNELFKNYCLEFKKAEFASLIAQNIENQNDLSEEIEDIILKILK